MDNNLQKELFVATLMHDLKNPVLAQISALSQLSNGSFGELNNLQKEIVDMTLESCQYVQKLIFTLLETYKNENGKIRPAGGPFGHSAFHPAGKFRRPAGFHPRRRTDPDSSEPAVCRGGDPGMFLFPGGPGYGFFNRRGIHSGPAFRTAGGAPQENPARCGPAGICRRN